MLKKKANKLFLIVVLTILTSISYSQINSLNPELIKPDPAKEKMFLPYMAVRHGGIPATEEWKKNNTYQYYLEIWYYSESFYVKRNHLNEGVELNESIVDISRFENSRKENEESIVVLPGFKDVLVLLPINKLIYKPSK